jgi:hypothetical protein
MDEPQNQEPEAKSDIQIRLEGLNLDSDEPYDELQVLKRLEKTEPSLETELPG